MIRQNENRPSLLAVCTLAAALVLAGQVTVWATKACQEPNPSEVFCVSYISSQDCDGESELGCTLFWDSVDRNKFPDGPVSSKSGTTTEEDTKCYCLHYCVWDDMAETCGSCEDCCDDDDPNWHNEDKTVVGETECPTEEDT